MCWRHLGGAGGHRGCMGGMSGDVMRVQGAAGLQKWDAGGGVGTERTPGAQCQTMQRDPVGAGAMPAGTPHPQLRPHPPSPLSTSGQGRSPPPPPHSLSHTHTHPGSIPPPPPGSGAALKAASPRSAQRGPAERRAPCAHLRPPRPPRAAQPPRRPPPSASWP